MNERIKELADQAELTIRTSKGTYMSHPEFNKKFAELIVKDVLGIISNPVNYNKCVYTTFDAEKANCVAHTLHNKIEEHFKAPQ